MRGRHLAIGALLILSLSARARAGVKTGARGTIGTGGYIGRSAYLQYGDVWRIKGGYSDYRFTDSTGTTRTASLRGAYQGESLAAGVTVSVTPRNDNYANRAFGADAGWTFVLGEDREDEAGLQEIEVGAWWTQTRHSQIIPINFAVQNEHNIIINQHDLGLSAAITGWDATLSIDAFRSIYDQDFANLPNATFRRKRLGDTASLVNGFPERGGSARLEYSRWRAFVPYASIAVTRYQIQPQPSSTTGSAGASFRFGGLGLDLGYEVVRQNGAADTKYFNFGGGVKF